MKQKVLVVDDEQLVADTLRLIFQRRGYDCQVAYSGKNAITCAETFFPDLLLCDLTMPEMDGVEVAVSIADKFPGCRVLLLTGHYINLKSMQHRIRALKVPYRVMMKPLPPEELLQHAHALLQITPQTFTSDFPSVPHGAMYDVEKYLHPQIMKR